MLRVFTDLIFIMISDNTRSIVMDKQGYIWVGSNKGVSRYDGEKWISYTTADGLARNEIRAIYPDNSGNVWFGTSNAISAFQKEVFVIKYHHFNKLALYSGSQNDELQLS